MFKAIGQKDTLLIWRNGEVIRTKQMKDLSDEELVQDLMEISYLFGVMDGKDKVEETVGAILGGTG